MPITPLHLGRMAPMVHWTHSWGALLAFTLVILWIDSQAIHAWFNELPRHDKGTTPC